MRKNGNSSGNSSTFAYWNQRFQALVCYQLETKDRGLRTKKLITKLF